MGDVNANARCKRAFSCVLGPPGLMTGVNAIMHSIDPFKQLHTQAQSDCCIHIAFLPLCACVVHCMQGPIHQEMRINKVVSSNCV